MDLGFDCKRGIWKIIKKYILFLLNIITACSCLTLGGCAEKYDFEEVVIGYPKNMNGTKSEKTEKIDSLIPRLEELGLIVHKWDERLTTVSAYKTMKEMKISQKEKNRVADRFAATYILEGYLNMLSR